MTTQYYLRRAPQVCPTCGHDPAADEVHVGHSAGGWVFLWHGWRVGEGGPAGPERPLDTPTAWIAFLAEAVERGGVIVDEYGNHETLESFVEIVELKRTKGPAGRPPHRHSDLPDTDAVHVDGDDFVFRGSP